MTRLTVKLATVLFCVSFSACHAGLNGEQALRDDEFKVQSDEENEPMSMSGPLLQGKCFSEWSQLISGWKSHGGGVLGSIEETRAQISNDGESAFSDAVRRIWAAQEKSDTRRGDIGGWPIPDSEFTAATFHALEAFEGKVSTDCQSSSWLGPLLWEEVKEADAAEVTSKRVAEMPEAVREDAHSAEVWLTYWLFVRIDRS